jgi:hypothetical protein
MTPRADTRRARRRDLIYAWRETFERVGRALRRALGHLRHQFREAIEQIVAVLRAGHGAEGDKRGAHKQEGQLGGACSR